MPTLFKNHKETKRMKQKHSIWSYTQEDIKIKNVSSVKRKKLTNQEYSLYLVRLIKKVKKNILFVELWNGRTPMKMVGSF